MKPNILFSLLSFIGMIAAAIYFNWSLPDIMLSLWISSFFVGYPTLIIWILSWSIHGGLLLPDRTTGESGFLAESFSSIGRVALVVLFLYYLFGFNVYVNAFVALLVLQMVLLALPVLENEYYNEECDELTFTIAIRNFFRLLPGTILVLFGVCFAYGVFLSGYSVVFRPAFIAKGLSEESLLKPFDFKGMISFALTFGKIYWPTILALAISQTDNIILAIKRPYDQQFTSPFKGIIKMHIMIMAMCFLVVVGFTKYIILPMLILFFLPVENYFFRDASQEPCDKQPPR